MKKRVTFTVDEDVVEGLKHLPRGLSVSDLVNSFLKVVIAEGHVDIGSTVGYVDVSKKRLRDKLMKKGFFSSAK